MNRNIIFGIFILLFLSLIVSYKVYINKKNELLSSYNRFLILKKKIEKVVELKNKYKELNINRLSFCKIDNFGDKFVLNCNNLDKNRFQAVENYIFKSNVKLHKFSIMKRKDKVNVSLEILK